MLIFHKKITQRGAVYDNKFAVTIIHSSIKKLKFVWENFAMKVLFSLGTYFVSVIISILKRVVIT